MHLDCTAIGGRAAPAAIWKRIRKKGYLQVDNKLANRTEGTRLASNKLLVLPRRIGSMRFICSKRRILKSINVHTQ